MCVYVCVLGQSWGGNGGGGAVTLCDGTGKIESYGDLFLGSIWAS